MNFYRRVAGSQLGSSILFGAALFAATWPTGGLGEAASAGGLAAAGWFACVPAIRRLAGAFRGA